MCIPSPWRNDMRFERREILKEKPAAGTQLGFGRYFTDYMLTMRYDRARGWHDLAIVPNEPVGFDLASAVLHYGQGVFEGMKAFAADGGRVARMQRSCARLCIPEIPIDALEEGLEQLLLLERDWIPAGEGTALYIRPAIVATRAELGVHASSEYLFFAILSPVGSYFEDARPVNLLAEDTCVRAVVGGTGEAKCLGNYAASLYAAALAQQKGFDQVLWLDADHRYVEEVGSMNIFFATKDEVMTPALVGSILPGITRKSCLELLRAEGVKTCERRISIEEVMEGISAGEIVEAFGTGTAAVITPVGRITYRGKEAVLAGGGKFTEYLLGEITGIQHGTRPDRFSWRKVFGTAH